MLYDLTLRYLRLAVLAAIGGGTAGAQTLQSGAPGFGWQWVRSHPFSIQGDAQDHSTWDINEYFGAGMTLLNREIGGTWILFDRPGPYADAPWQSFLSPGSDGIDQYNSLRTLPGNVGWIVGDEPSRLAMDNISTVVSYIRSTDPSQVVYTTAVANSSAQRLYGDTSHPSYSYSNYLNDFVNVIRPDILAYDSYPFLRNGTTHSDYFNNLMQIRSTAQANGLPYWAWLQAFSDQVRYPSESDNRFNIFTYLATGYTGFIYWTYSIDVYPTGGLIDANGNPTALYPAAAKANGEAARLGQTLRYLTSTDVRFVAGKHVIFTNVTTSNSIPSGLSNWAVGSGGDPHLTNVSVDFAQSNSIGTDKNGLIGFFTDDNSQHYFMLTNLYHGATLSADDATLSFAMTFDSTINSIYWFNRLTGQQELLSLTNHQLNWTLPGGTGDLFSYNLSSVPEPGFCMLFGTLFLLRRSHDCR